MIANIEEYQKAQEELEHLEHRLRRLQQEHPLPSKGLTKVRIRKMICRLHEELGVYEASREVQSPKS